MIPLQLHLKNFLSYGATLQTVDFTPYPLICLSGKNGHGKSALLDAITWAIWGQARKTTGVAKADHHLLRLGQNQMLVIFDFEFNGQTYRIRREFALTHGKQYASLDFALVQNNALVSLSQKTIRETQTTIEATVGLDYDSFINSAFLRQGQSNEFSKKSPKERKDILATILGLNHYELLRKRAVEKVKQATLEIGHLTKFQEKITHDLQKVPHLTTALQTLADGIAKIVHQEKKYTEHRHNLDKEKNNLVAQQHHQEHLHKQYTQLIQEKNNASIKINAWYQAWKIIHHKYLTFIPPEHTEKQKKILIERIAFYQQKIQKDLEVKEKLLDAKNKQQELAHRITNDFQKKVHVQQLLVGNLQTSFAAKKQHLEQLFAQLTTLAQELSTIEHESTPLKIENKNTHSEQQLCKQEQRFEKRKMFYHQWIAYANGIKEELDKLRQKQKFTHDETNPSCPLCEQNLSASRKKFLKNHFSKQDHFLNHRLQRLTTIIKALKDLLVEQHATLEKDKKKAEQQKIMALRLEDLTKHGQKLSAHQKQLELEYKTAEQELHMLNNKAAEQAAQLEKLQQREQEHINQDTEYSSTRDTISALSELLKNSADNYQHLQQLSHQVALLEQQSTLVHHAAQEMAQKQDYSQQIVLACTNLKMVNKNIGELSRTLKTFDNLDAQLKTVISAQQELQHQVQQLQKEKEALLQQKGSLEREWLTLTGLELEFKKQQQQLIDLQERCNDYQTIATAVSKEGIQALIIEEALPEIEQEANMLLSQLTDNQSHIIIESLRDLKKGGTKETLDIKISDAVGIRPYELFSGGEAFRIDFALRLAISKLLARRAGTSLQTLIIDEGFGSQDEDGLAHIMDALYKIQDSFCKIIIVSHLPSMKDQFPVHFFIEKGSQGSSLRVIEQG